MDALRLVALAFALAEVDHKVREQGGNNRGPRVRLYLDNLDPPMAEGAAWCAAFVQWCSDRAAGVVGVTNPLDAVKREALVADYVTKLEMTTKSQVQPGHLAAFKFGRSGRWNHIGFLLTPPKASGKFTTVEGNTGSKSQRDGDGVFIKTRSLARGYSVRFLRWTDE